MASIEFFTLTTGYSHNLKTTGSGLGFFATGGFGKSVSVGQYQKTTYITDGNGAVQGAQVNNVEYIHPLSGEVAGGVELLLQKIPNYQATVMVEVTNATAIQVQNANLYCYDRVNKNNNPSGVTCKIAESIHVGTDQAATGSGDTTWYTPTGSSVIVPLADSPGISGLYAGNGTDSTRADTTHDWFINISASPNSIGAKTQFGLWFDAEYI